jgi:alkyl hydroperoxide reductase subunit F
LYDLIIIGAGPAGLAAAVYAARQKISFAVISENVGGQTVWSSDVENYLGFHLVSGSELVAKFEEHLTDYRIRLLRETARSVEKIPSGFRVRTGKAAYESKTVLIASGKIPRKLNVPGEEKFLGKGVTYCATCDAPVFAGKDVAVVGGGNAAMDAAILAEKYCKSVHVVNINPALRGEKQMLKRVAKSAKIKVHNNSRTTGILGNRFVRGIKFTEGGREKSLSVQGVLVEIGSVPSTSFDRLTKKNAPGEIIIHEDKKRGISNLTSIPGIFAAGDVTDVAEKQIIVAGGEGVKAVLGVFKHLAGKNAMGAKS